jgi:hypothetical protein
MTIMMTEMMMMRYRWCVQPGEKVRTAEILARSDYGMAAVDDPVSYPAGRGLQRNGNAAKNGFL